MRRTSPWKYPLTLKTIAEERKDVPESNLFHNTNRKSKKVMVSACLTSLFMRKMVVVSSYSTAKILFVNITILLSYHDVSYLTIGICISILKEQQFPSHSLNNKKNVF